MAESNTKVNVLFVDDDERLLQGLRRMLRGMRDEWEMTFVTSGAQALEFMAGHPVDVIVSDMRMPKMDGAQLLSEVQTLYPGTMRIILSGFAENETVLRTVGPSHQYLAKPCDPELLKKTISRSLYLKTLLDDENLRRVVAGLKTVPSPSSAYRNLIAELSSPSASAGSVAKSIGADIGMTAQTLKLTNSAYFSLPQKVVSIEQAVKLLGFDTIRSLATIADFYQTYGGDPVHLKILETLSARSMVVAALTRKICTAEGLDAASGDTAFCAGLMAHVGTLVLVANLLEKFDEATGIADRENISICDAERRVFGATHAQLGAYLLGLWGFSCHVVQTVATHHRPERSGGDEFGIAGAVHVAQFLTRDMGHGAAESENMIRSFLDEAWLERIGRTGRLPVWRKLYEEVLHGRG